MEIKNCSFSYNGAQFGGAIFLVIDSESQIILNITNSILLSNNATKATTYLGVDFSQAGCLILFTNYNSSVYISNSFISQSYSRKGFYLFLFHLMIYIISGGVFTMIHGNVFISNVTLVGLIK